MVTEAVMERVWVGTSSSFCCVMNVSMTPLSRHVERLVINDETKRRARSVGVFCIGEVESLFHIHLGFDDSQAFLHSL